MISRSGEDVVKEVSSRLLMRSFMIESVVKEVSYHLLVLSSSLLWFKEVSRHIRVYILHPCV